MSFGASISAEALVTVFIALTFPVAYSIIHLQGCSLMAFPILSQGAAAQCLIGLLLDVGMPVFLEAP